jgi:hypothetical protein
MSSVQQFTQQFTALWWQLSGDAPQMERAFSTRQQGERERMLDEFLSTLGKTLRQPMRSERERQALQQQVVALGGVFAKSALDFGEEHLGAVQTSGIAETAIDFSQQARRYDPTISSDDIYQAARNVMTMNLLQLMAGLPVEVTPSVFAYSMLYPYTDNYLDDPAIAAETKRAFNARFRRRLLGEAVTPANLYEEHIADMVGMIEGQYSRAQFPQVYDSLLDIHAAQARSMQLHRREASPYELDVLGLSFEKGGTAVLADAYLVSGTPTPQQLEVAFGYGAFTQLMDDLEDAQRDGSDGIMTVFSQTARRWPLDAITNRLFHFGDWVLDHMGDYGPGAPVALQDVMRRSVHLLLADSVGTLAGLYSKPYLAALETHMPFRFAALKQQRHKLERQRGMLMKLVEMSAGAVTDMPVNLALKPLPTV